jgi:D-lyxose ketol-isomerase
MNDPGLSISPLKRSVINASIDQAAEAFARFHMALPPWASWTVADWCDKGHEFDEIRHCMLGWDVTDFGSGQLKQIGRTLLTLRNGTSRFPGYAKTYAEKLLFDPEGQRAPAHFHRSKREDICCRAGGNILVRLTAADEQGQPSGGPLQVSVDGHLRTVVPGEVIRLRPGMSVCIAPRTIHQFWGEEGAGLAVSSEVSSVCDDWNDNVFLQPACRFPQVLEDEPPRHWLCHEYPPAAV